MDKFTDIDLSSVTTNYTVVDLVIVRADESHMTGRYIDIVVNNEAFIL